MYCWYLRLAPLERFRQRATDPLPDCKLHWTALQSTGANQSPLMSAGEKYISVTTTHNHNITLPTEHTPTISYYLLSVLEMRWIQIKSMFEKRYDSLMLNTKHKKWNTILRKLFILFCFILDIGKLHINNIIWQRNAVEYLHEISLSLRWVEVLP